MATVCGHCGAGNEDEASVCVSCGRPPGPPEAASQPEPESGSPGEARDHPPSEPTMVRPAPRSEDATMAPPPSGRPSSSQPPQGPPPQEPPPQQTAPLPPDPPGGQPPPQQPPPPGYAPPAPGQAAPPPAYAPPQQPPPGYPPPPYGYPPQQQQPAYPQQGYPPPGYGPGHAPATPRVNPFLDWPVTDYVRDAGALFCAFATLGMYWNLGGSTFGAVAEKGGDHWWVLVSVLLTAVSVVVPYVGKAQLVPGLTPQHHTLTKLGLNAPMAVSVLVAVVNELVHVGDDFEGGVGVGVGMGLAALVLAVQPRAAEEDPARPTDTTWPAITRSVILASVGLTVLLWVTWLIHGIVDSGVDLFGDPLTLVVRLVGMVGLCALVVCYPAVMAVIDGGPGWRRILGTVGFTVLVVALLAGRGDGLFTFPFIDKWYGAIGGAFPAGATLLLGAAAALALSRPSLRAGARSTAPLAGWVDTVRSSLLITTGASTLFALALLLSMIAADDVGAAGIVAVVLAVACGGAAAFGLTLVSQAGRHRLLLLGICAGLVVVGFVVMGVVNGADLGLGLLGPEGTWTANSGWIVAAWVTLPLLCAGALTVPRAARAAFGPLLPAQQGGPPPGGPGGPGAYPEQPDGQQPGAQQPGPWGPPPQRPPQPGGWGPPPAPPGQPGQWGPPPQQPPQQPPQPGGWGPPRR